MHYGHPDIFDRFFVQTCGSCSKASNGINLSEDIFAGFNCTARGYCVHHADYIQVRLQYYNHQTFAPFESRHLWHMKAGSVSTLVPCPHRSTQIWLLYLASVVGKDFCSGRFLRESFFTCQSTPSLVFLLTVCVSSATVRQRTRRRSATSCHV